MDFLTKPITSERLEEIGQLFYKLGKGFFFYGLIGLAMFLLSIIGALVINGGEGVSYLLKFDLSGYEFMYIILPLSYVGITFGVAGVPMYFSGLIIFALGRIAHNTENGKHFKSQNTEKVNVPTSKSIVKSPKESKKNTSVKENLDYINVECPSCKNELSFDVHMELLDSYECPYCNQKIHISKP